MDGVFGSDGAHVWAIGAPIAYTRLLALRCRHLYARLHPPLSAPVLRVAPKDAGVLGAWASRTPVNIIYRSGLRRKGDAHHKIRLYVDIRARTAALEIVEHRLALRFELRCIELVFDLSLESITFNCSYNDQRTIGGRKAAGLGYPARVDKDTPLRSGLLHPHFACATALLGVVTSRRDGLRIRWCDLCQSDGDRNK